MPEPVAKTKCGLGLSSSIVIFGVIGGPAKAGRHVRSPPSFLHSPDLPDLPGLPDLPDVPGYCGRPCAT
jgi:hypothetical protein